jgi:hypothetical protein
MAHASTNAESKRSWRRHITKSTSTTTRHAVDGALIEATPVNVLLLNNPRREEPNNQSFFQVRD